MSKINKRVLLSVSVTFVVAFFFVSLGQVNVNSNGVLDLGPAKTFATGDGGGGSGGGNGEGDFGNYNCYQSGTCNPQTCTNGATNYPYCNNNQCTNGATNFPYCNNNVCTNGATNFPNCNVCPANYVLQNGQCVYHPPTCTNGATNYPYCNNNVCSNGATNFPYCNNNVCTNGATNYPQCDNNHCNNGCHDYPHCVTCPTGYTLVNGQCVYQTPTCTNGATNYPYCNNQCTPLGTQTQYLNCSYGQTGQITQQRTHSCPGNVWTSWVTTSNTCVTNTCNNGCYDYPNCVTCPSGYTLVNGQCIIQIVNPTATINVNPNSIYSGNSTVLSWSSTNASYCTITGNGANFYTTQGSQTIYPSQSGTYIINCTGVSGGTATAQTYVSVISQPVQTCSNGATNYPYCNNNQTCPTGYVWSNGTCQIYQNYSCTNGATNYPYCNNQYTPPTYTYCNGVQYSYGYTCPVYVQQNLNVSTTGATPLVTTATIYGYVNPDNTNATIWFDYGTSYSNLQWQTTRQSTSYAGQFSAALSGLQCGTRYYYRAVAQNANSTKYGSVLSFLTQNCPNQNNYDSSAVITRLATAVGYYSAQFNGSFITSNTNDRSCQAFFDYGTNYNLGKRTTGQTLYNNTTVNYFSKAVSGLSPNTTYYYRAGVTCLDGTKFGNIVSFRTPTYIVPKKKTTYVPPVAKTEVKNTPTCLCDDDYFSLVLENLENGAEPGKLANFRLMFKNTSKENLRNVAIRVILPEELTIYSADTGQYTKGGKTLLVTIPNLPSMQEGGFIITANVPSTVNIGQQMVVNAYADYTVPTVVKSGLPKRGEVTAYTISIASKATENASTNNSTNGNINTTGTTSTFWSWLPTNFMDWVIAILVFAVFVSALRYVLTAFRSSN